MTPYIQVTVTVPELALAERLADLLLELRLVACVQLFPCSSHYHWRRRIEHNDEVMCLMKTRQDLFAELSWTVRSEHPYRTPEIIALPIVEASEGYLSWMSAVLRPITGGESL